MDAAGIRDKVLENADAGGRPYLTGEDGGTKDLPRISISHSGDYVAVAISDREVGVDIQKRRSVRESLTDRVMSPEEKREYDRLCSEDAGSEAAREYFLSVWTAKEAVSKMDGRGIFAMLPELSRDGWKEKAKAKILSRKIADDYMLAVAYH
ncbi:MAG: 4'-phosphopantetheinyl transferase superfamily protein [Lachnospiraceae bacterium]|nr:4'-phosphopantetheinyl transferase superfamily protein [Lachnospiraceae bacterium]